MTEYIPTFFVGVLGSLVSSTAGAGAGLITSPYFILLGLPPQTAVATAKLGGVGMIIGSLEKFRKTDNIRWEFIIPFIAINVVAGLIGAKILLSLDNNTIRYIVATAILISAPLLLFSQAGLERKKTSKQKHVAGYVLMLAGQSIQAAFGSGLGILTALVSMHSFGMTALEANATKRIPGLVKELVIIPTFIIAGAITYGHGTAILLGSLIGGYLGAHIAIKKGNKFIKRILAVVVIAMAVKLLIQ